MGCRGDGRASSVAALEWCEGHHNDGHCSMLPTIICESHEANTRQPEVRCAHDGVKRETSCSGGSDIGTRIDLAKVSCQQRDSQLLSDLVARCALGTLFGYPRRAEE